MSRDTSNRLLGGANLIDDIKCKSRYDSDVNPYLISLLQYLQTDPMLKLAPIDCSKEHYADVRDCYNHLGDKYSMEYIALIGYSASYGGRFFDGGYGKDPSGKRNIYQERIINLREQAPKLKDINFSCKDYIDYKPDDYYGCVFVCDPPYKNTKQYSKVQFDYEQYYDWCRKMSDKNIVIMCEYNMPDDFDCIWSKERKVMQKSNRETGEIAVEKLFVYRK